jgi:hypothetical protein
VGNCEKAESHADVDYDQVSERKVGTR